MNDIQLTDLDERETRALLSRAASDEPSFTGDLASVRRTGVRLRRQRRGLAGIALVTTCAAAGATFAVVPSLVRPATHPHTSVAPGSALNTTPVATTPRPNEDRPTSAPVATSQAQDAGLKGNDATIADAIRASSPATFTLVLASGGSEPGSIEGTADDGAGVARLAVGLSAGTQQVHPCDDPEFANGGACSERSLPDGSVLTRHHYVSDGYVSNLVSLAYADGSGVLAESGNYTIGEPRRVYASGEKPRSIISRSDPTYTLSELEQVVIAVAEATS